MDNDLYKIFEKSYFNQKYYLKEFKGAGAFGAVFLADEVVGGTKIQEVAIKAIRKDKMSSETIAKELITAIKLKHPNLINCITSEEGQLTHSAFNYPCFGLVMEIASGTLEDYLQTNKPQKSRVLPVSEVRDIVHAIASGLVYLHGQSVTHRDLKPANVLRVGNTWKISDFGIARQMGRESGTMTTGITGTPIYMPPEVYVAYSDVRNQVRIGMREREEGSIKAWQKKSNTERPCALQV
jgi:serine/threonine protein kinase